MLAPAEAFAALPDSLDAAEAAPLLCACITTFNALRHSGAGPDDLVAIQGIGGLGHLGVQFASKFGYRPPPTPPLNFRSSAVLASSWQPRQTPKPFLPSSTALPQMAPSW